MQVYLNEINGIADALVAFTMTRRTWSPDFDQNIRDLVSKVNTSRGYFKGCRDNDVLNENDDEMIYNKKLERVLNFAKDHVNSQTHAITTGHITLISFIDLSITVEGLHYAGVADVDSHAYRFHNRILRTSSRAKQDVFGPNEMSEYYSDKIIPTDMAVDILSMNLPDQLLFNGKTYVKTVNGYIQEEYADKQDVKRGLYMLSIPSNFIFRINLLQFCHVYQQRCYSGHANPEVQRCIEMVADEVEKFQPLFNRDLFNNVHQ